VLCPVIAWVTLPAARFAWAGETSVRLAAEAFRARHAQLRRLARTAGRTAPPAR
jgi:hypothetical protein